MMVRYNELLREHFLHPRRDDFVIGIQYQITKHGSALEGELIHIYLAVNEYNVITHIYYKVLGNPFLIALLSYLSEQFTNQSIESIKNYSFSSLVELFAIPKNRRYCVMLIEDMMYEQYEQWKKRDDN